MKLRSVKHNNRKKAFEIKTSSRTLQFPYSKLELQPSGDDPIDRVYVDKELANEGFTYVLKSGKTGTVHVEQVLEYNQDPAYLRDALLYKLTLEAKKRLQKSALSKREVIRRLGTSATQFYRLLDQNNYQTSVDQLLSLLHVLDCEVDLVIRARTHTREKAAIYQSADQRRRGEEDPFPFLSSHNSTDSIHAHPRRRLPQRRRRK